MTRQLLTPKTNSNSATTEKSNTSESFIFSASSAVADSFRAPIAAPGSQPSVDLLNKLLCGLSNLLQGDGNLEHVRGKDFIGMFLCGKQGTLLSGLKSLWSRRRVKVEKKEEYIALIDCNGTVSSNDDPQWPNSPPNSPVTDRSASPPPHVIRGPAVENIVKYQFYRLSFAGRDLPILAISYYDPKVTTKRICCYGGSKEMEDDHGERYMERSFFSSRK